MYTLKMVGVINIILTALYVIDFEPEEVAMENIAKLD